MPLGSGTYKFGFAEFLAISHYVVAKELKFLGISYRLKIMLRKEDRRNDDT